MNINEVKVPLKTAINLLEQWGNDERAMELLHAILRDLDAEPPKPTGEQLKAIGKVLDGDAPRECKVDDVIFVSDVLGQAWSIKLTKRPNNLMIGKLRWHLKDAPAPKAKEPMTFIETWKCDFCKPGCELRVERTEVGLSPIKCPLHFAGVKPIWTIKHPVAGSPAQPAQMICNHDNYEYDNGICDDCCGFSNWMAKQPEPVKRTNCLDCRFDDEDGGQNYECKDCRNYNNYTPKEPEPVVKENFTAVEPVKRTCRNCGMPANDCGRDWLSRKASKSVPIWCKNWTPKEPEPAAPGVNYT